MVTGGEDNWGNDGKGDGIMLFYFYLEIILQKRKYLGQLITEANICGLRTGKKKQKRRHQNYSKGGKLNFQKLFHEKAFLCPRLSTHE